VAGRLEPNLEVKAMLVSTEACGECPSRQGRLRLRNNGVGAAGIVK
jgi:hypothetical protein